MIQALLIIAGVIVGGVIAWLLMRSQGGAWESTVNELRGQVRAREAAVTQLQANLDTERTGRVTAETRLAEAFKNIEEQKKLLEEATRRLTDTFSALSAEALKSNNQLFLELSKNTLEKVLADAKGDLGKRQEAVEGMIKPLKETLTRYETQIRELENARQQAYGGLKKQLEDIGKANEQLQKETGALVTALKTPQVRGRWGEITLRRVVEVAGMSQYCDFAEQPSVDTEEGRKRPDLIVKLPGERTVVVDAKVPLKAYLEAMEADSEEKRKAQIARHSQAVREHMKALGSKAYWNQFNPTPDFVVLFLPGESYFSAALEQDRALIEDGISSRVILATPTTLIALLRTVALTWQQQQVTENSQKILAAGVDLFDRVVKFAEHLEGIRDGLGKAMKSYNAALGSWESRVAPGARRLKELGAAAPEKELKEIEPLESSLRELPDPSKKE